MPSQTNANHTAESKPALKVAACLQCECGARYKQPTHGKRVVQTFPSAHLLFKICALARLYVAGNDELMRFSESRRQHGKCLEHRWKILSRVKSARNV